MTQLIVSKNNLYRLPETEKRKIMISSSFGPVIFKYQRHFIKKILSFFINIA